MLLFTGVLLLKIPTKAILFQFWMTPNYPLSSPCHVMHSKQKILVFSIFHTIQTSDFRKGVNSMAKRRSHLTKCFYQINITWVGTQLSTPWHLNRWLLYVIVWKHLFQLKFTLQIQVPILKLLYSNVALVILILCSSIRDKQEARIWYYTSFFVHWNSCCISHPITRFIGLLFVWSEERGNTFLIEG